MTFFILRIFNLIMVLNVLMFLKCSLSRNLIDFIKLAVIHVSVNNVIFINGV